jgi:single-strand DNA-binding protein
MINKVILLGNLGKDPEIRHLEGGTSVAKFPIATNENYRDKSGEWQKKTEWHDVVCWRHLAERAEKILKKGNLVYVEGKITHRKWQDKEGNDRYTTEVVANVLRSLEKREPVSSGYSDNFPSAESEPAKPKDTLAEDVSQMENDDLPF